MTNENYSFIISFNSKCIVFKLKVMSLSLLILTKKKHSDTFLVHILICRKNVVLKKDFCYTLIYSAE